ncbi:hypothetical protein ACFYKX_03115 [Cytobacillus sp. FJAT-54145]|uniref:Phenylalanyl-tRNA synthetase subunit beta n=1 Tax=Cytobacillus spartinae TaxID=3299023 RepID=A0ABW6K603_9BACI
MKVIKFFVIFIVALGVIGYGLYHFGTSFASEKLVDTVTTELESSGELEKIKQTIESDPELSAFIAEAKTADTSSLPFSTKEEATKILIKKVGITELNNIRMKVQNGSATTEEILADIQNKLTEEEILALKVIAYKKLYNK